MRLMQYRPDDNSITDVLAQNTPSVQAGRRAILPIAVSPPKPTLARPRGEVGGGIHMTTVPERCTILVVEDQLSSRNDYDRTGASAVESLARHQHSAQVQCERF
ncbi:hypothetical protein PM082_001892 [Marasmius tenuissimus]|nr:hypothetical protein PM082_001892 [Marasmius tenuissimus]